MNTGIKEHPPVLSEEMGAATTFSPHPHHWVIEEAVGPVSLGQCKYCRAVRSFKNWDSTHDFTLNAEARLGC